MPTVEHEASAMAERITALTDYASAKKRLRELSIIRSERVLGEIGEFYFLQLFGGTAANATSQKGWDISWDGKRVQVKSHAKSSTNPAEWTNISLYDPERPGFDLLFLLIFTQDLVLSRIYWCGGRPLQAGTRVVKWRNLDPFPLTDIPDGEFLQKLKANRLIAI